LACLASNSSRTTQTQPKLAQTVSWHQTLASWHQTLASWHQPARKMAAAQHRTRSWPLIWWEQQSLI
jgi:hypothetical protein